MSDISDHLPLLIEINNKNHNLNNATLLRRNMKTFSQNTFLLELQKELKLLPNNIYSNVNSYVSNFIQIFQNTIDKHAPMTKLSRKEQKLQTKPWITKPIMKLIKHKNSLYRKFIKQKTERSKIEYRNVRNIVTHSLEKSKKSYYNNIFTSNQNDSKSIWKNINKIVNYKSSKSTNIVKIEDENGKDMLEPKDISNSFNNFFCTVGEKISKTIPTTQTSFDPTSLIQSPPKSLFLNPVSTQEISTLIKSMDQNKSVPSQNIPTKFIKMAEKIVNPHLRKIFNFCLSTGQFPSEFKTSEIIPIHKSGSKTDLSNYRPISLISPFSKLLEKCIYKRINNFFTNNKLMYEYQFGFRDRSSCENAVLQISEQLLMNIDNKEINCSVLIDLKKAFDTVNHTILLNKLHKYGIRGIPLKLITNYLTERTQHTLINTVKSNPKTTLYGVLQGSTLAPLLFNIYINDLSLASKLKLNLFADDAYLSTSHYTPKTLEQTVNNELIGVYKWLNTNKLSLNTNKTSYLIITKRKINHSFNIKIGNNTIQESTSAKYLGITIDNRLDWKQHIQNVKAKTARGCWALRQLQPYVGANTLKMVYHALIHSNLSYCISCWGWVPKSNLHSLQKYQNRALRTLCTVSNKTKMSPLYHGLSILKVNDIYTFQMAKIMFQIDTNTWIGSYNLTHLKQMHSHNTRHSKTNYYRNRISNGMARGALSVAGPKIWSKVPEALKSTNFYTFKQQLKNIYLDQYLNE